MFSDPVIEQYRVNADGKSFTGVFTLAYPNMKTCIVLGYTNDTKLRASQVRCLINHVRRTGRKEIIYYRQKDSENSIEKRIVL